MTNDKSTAAAAEPEQDEHQASQSVGVAGTVPASKGSAATSGSKQHDRRNANASRIARHGQKRHFAQAKGGTTAPTCKVSKTASALKLLRRKNGASLAELQESTGWQSHSVRGFLSGMVKKKLGLDLSSEMSKQGVRRYRIDMSVKIG